MTTTRLICTECGTGHFESVGCGLARCGWCEQEIDVDRDARFYADDGATVEVDAAGYLVAVTA